MAPGAEEHTAIGGAQGLISVTLRELGTLELERGRLRAAEQHFAEALSMAKAVPYLAGHQYGPKDHINIRILLVG